MSDVQKYGEGFQRVGKDGFDAAVSSFGEVNKGLQAIAAEFAAYGKSRLRTALAPSSSFSVQNRSSRYSISSLSTQEWLMKPMLPSCLSSVRCMLV